MNDVGRMASSRPRRGADLQTILEVPFHMACFGGEKTVQVRREETCSRCNGEGIDPGATDVQCKQCKGSGTVAQVQKTPLGVMQVQQACPSCGGTGIDPSAVCTACRGS